MVRIGLSLYLMFSVLAGPWLCCCTTERLVAALFAPPTQQTSQSGCCGHDKHPTGCQKHRTPEQRSGDHDRPSRSPCPCKEDSPQQVPLATLDSAEIANQLQSRHTPQGPVELVPLVQTVFGLVVEGDRQTSAEGILLPFLSAQDILRAHHNLRC